MFPAWLVAALLGALAAAEREEDSCLLAINKSAARGLSEQGVLSTGLGQREIGSAGDDLVYNWTALGSGYCRDIYGENPWQSTASCVDLEPCKQACANADCVAIAWSGSPSLNYSDCEPQGKARCVIYTGLGDAVTVSSPPTEYVCYARLADPSGLPFECCPTDEGCTTEFQYSHTGYWVGGDADKVQEVTGFGAATFTDCYNFCKDHTCTAYAWVGLKKCLIYTGSGGKAVSDFSSVACTKTSTLGEACFDRTWLSSSFASCRDYELGDFCTANGRYSIGWDRSQGTFRSFARNGLSAAGACCACGGGSVAQDCASYTTEASCPLRCAWDGQFGCIYSEVVLKSQGQVCSPANKFNMKGVVNDIAGCQHAALPTQFTLKYVCDYNDLCGGCSNLAPSEPDASCSLYEYKAKTCATGWICPGGYEPNPDQVDSTTLSEENCCLKDCDQYSIADCPAVRCQNDNVFCRRLSGSFTQSGPGAPACDPDFDVSREDLCQSAAQGFGQPFAGVGYFSQQPVGCIVVDGKVYYNERSAAAGSNTNPYTRFICLRNKIPPIVGYEQTCSACYCQIRSLIAVDVPTSAACQQRCDQDNDCAYFNYDFTDDECWACPEDLGRIERPDKAWVWRKLACDEITDQLNCPATRCKWVASTGTCAVQGECEESVENANYNLTKLTSYDTMYYAGWRFNIQNSTISFPDGNTFRGWQGFSVVGWIEATLTGSGKIGMLIKNDFSSGDVWVTQNGVEVARITRAQEELVEFVFSDGDSFRISEDFAIIWLKSVVFDCEFVPSTTTTPVPCSSYTTEIECAIADGCVWDSFNKVCEEGTPSGF